VAGKFEQTLLKQFDKLRIGDPLRHETDLGPPARLDPMEKLHDQVWRSFKAGANILAGGELLNTKGFFYPPTILRGVSRDMPVFEDETFGPVAAVMRVEDANHAVRVANTSRIGLGASIWTNDTVRGAELAAHIEAGCVRVNGIVQSYPRLPFSGIKPSGYGRELSDYGIGEFVNVKTVCVA
jgi:succinate-semialdehyde dehydrogenase/glutarate-semialdehyde dehydrogenase